MITWARRTRKSAGPGSKGRGRPREALKKLESSLPLYKKEKTFRESLCSLGPRRNLSDRGRHEKGLRELQTAFRLYLQIKDAEGQAYTCCALGGIYRMLGRYAESGNIIAKLTTGCGRTRIPSVSPIPTADSET